MTTGPQTAPRQDRPDAPAPFRGVAPRWRRGAATTMVALPAPVVAWTGAAWRDDLPDPMPTHWSGTYPDEFTSYTANLWGILIGTLVAALVATAVHLVDRVPPLVRRITVAASAAASWLAFGIWVAFALASWHTPDAARVQIAGWVPLALAAMAVGGVGAGLVYGATPLVPHPPDADAESPVAVVGSGQHVVWTRRVAAPMFWSLAAAVLMLAAAAFVISGQVWVAVLMVLSAALLAGFSSVRVMADRRGVQVSAGALGWPRRSFPLADIERASSTTVRPTEWGGWGYRVMPGRSALVLRAGPGLVLDLVDGRRFAVTVDDARTGAGVINALLERRAAALGIRAGGP